MSSREIPRIISVWIVGFLLSNIITSASSNADEAYLTPEMAVAIALQKNPRLKAADSRLRRDEAEVEAAATKMWPTLSVEAGPHLLLDDAEAPARDQYVTAFAKIDWNLYRGGTDQALIEQMSVRQKLTQKQRRQIEADIVAEVKQLTTSLLYHAEAIALHARALEQSRTLQKSAKAKHAAGLTSKTDQLEFEIYSAELESELVELKALYDDQQRQLARLLGESSLAQPIRIQGELLTSAPVVDIQKIEVHAQEFSKEVEELEALKVGVADGLADVRSSYAPSIDIEGRYGLFSDAARNKRALNSGDFNELEMLLKLTVPIVGHKSSAGRYRLQGGGEEMAAYSFEIEDIKAKTRQILASNVARQKSYEQRINIEDRNIVTAKTYLDLTLAEYKVGVKNSPDLVSATDRLLRANLSRLDAVRGLNESIIALDRMIGHSSAKAKN